MPVVAYLANQFPSPVEPYVFEEIAELRRRGMTVIPCSPRRSEEVNLATVRGEVRPKATSGPEPRLKSLESETLYLQPLRLGLLFRALGLCVWHFNLLADLLDRSLLQGNDPFGRRARALLHTLLGACYALKLKDSAVEHIHVHHGYFGSWIAMVAARLLESRSA